MIPLPSRRWAPACADLSRNSHRAPEAARPIESAASPRELAKGRYRREATHWMKALRHELSASVSFNYSRQARGSPRASARSGSNRALFLLDPRPGRAGHDRAAHPRGVAACADVCVVGLDGAPRARAGPPDRIIARSLDLLSEPRSVCDKQFRQPYGGTAVRACAFRQTFQRSCLGDSPFHYFRADLLGARPSI